MKISLSLCLLALLPLISSCTTAPASSKPEPPTSLDPEGWEDAPGPRCLNLSQIDTTRIIDSRTIEFHMRNGKVYANVLPHKCHGLRPNKPFTYRTSMNRLCDLDMISVLETGGPTMRRGMSCGLGRFQELIVGGGPITDDEE
jgi:hypothetical protein